jgi:predicted dehydrogenase
MKRSIRHVKIGLIGCGRVAREHHLPSLKRVPGAEIFAVTDIDLEKAAGIAKIYSIPHVYPSYNDLLSDPRIEGVGVLTPTASHHEIGLAALGAGKHLFLEKPLALSRLACDQLIEAARKSGKKTMTCFNLRWHRLIREALAVIDSGRVGDIKAVTSKYTHFRNIATAQKWHKQLEFGGGVSFNENIHHFDLWRFLLKKEIEEVFAFHRESDFYKDETSLVSARLEEDILASCFGSMKTSPESELVIFGTDGRLSVNLYRFDGLDFLPSTAYPGSTGYRVRSILQSLGKVPSLLAANRYGGGFAETFYFAWEHFIRCVTEDREPECSFEDGRQAVLTALAVVESFKKGKMTMVDGDHRLIADE